MSTRADGRHYPWYKERLQWKYLANQQRQLNTLISHKWRFFSSINDRSLYPDTQQLPEKKPPLLLPIINPKPNLTSCCTSTHRPYKPTTIAAAKMIYSQLSTGQQGRQERINDIERNLLEEDRVYKKHDSDVHVHVRNVDFNSEETNLEFLSDELSVVQSKIKSDRNAIYQWPLLKSTEEKAEEELEIARQRAVSPTQEAQVNEVTHELIEWSKNLGDEEEYIDETTIKRIFASDYEAKPVLTAPIHIVELKNIPRELRTESRGCTGSSYRAISAIEQLKHLESSPSPRGVRYKYGAWYLRPSLWKLRPSLEPLEDPKVVKKREEMEIRMKNESLDAVLSETHGALAFKEFVIAKYKDSLPEFVKPVKPIIQKNKKN